VANQVEWNKVVYNTLPSDVSLGSLPCLGSRGDPPVAGACGPSQQVSRRTSKSTWPHWYDNIVMVHNNWVFGKENELRRFEEARALVPLPALFQAVPLRTVRAQSRRGSPMTADGCMKSCVSHVVLIYDG